MKISSLIALKYKENHFTLRHFNENNPEGMLGAGFVQKKTTQGSHIDFELNFYSGLLILSGTGYYQDAAHEKIPIEAGCFVQRLPNKKHNTIVTSDDWKEIYVCVGQNLFNSLKEIGVVSDKPVLSTGLDYELIEEISKFIDDMDKINTFELTTLVPAVIAILSRATLLDKQNAHGSEVLDMLTLSCQYMQTHIKDRIAVEEVAREMEIGYEKYRKLFTNHYGISPGHYMIRQRIHQAQKLLSNPQNTIQSVAMELGYADAYVFSKQFKSVIGVSPTEFKRLYLL